MNSLKSAMLDLRTFCNASKGTALFDLDGTLLYGDLGETAFLYALICNAIDKQHYKTINYIQLRDMSWGEVYKRIQYSSEWELICEYKELLNKSEFKKAYSLTAKYIEQFSENKVLELTIEVFKQFFTPYTITTPFGPINLFCKTNEMMLHLLQHCVSQGLDVLIVSGSPQSVVESFHQVQGLKNVQCIGANSKLDIIPYAEGKPYLLAEIGITKDIVLAVGNSEGDKEMLELAQQSILFNCEDPDFMKVGFEKGWNVLC
ncbi:MAG: haloacid dehalogenase-like hydrolase [Sphaerochaetaceae bacterium]